MRPIGPQTGSAIYLAGVCLAASLGGLLFGFDTAVISGTVGFVESQFALDKGQVGWLLSSALVGCVVGAALAGTLGDRFGRLMMDVTVDHKEPRRRERAAVAAAHHDAA